MERRSIDSSELQQRNEETLRFITNRVRNWRNFCSGIEDQKILMDQVSSFFAPEIEEAMKYTGKLPSFRNCGGKSERMELLKQEAELIIYEQLLLTPEQAEDFDDSMQRFRQAIREKLLKYTQTAQRESFHVEVKHDRKTNENEKCTIISGKKDVTDDITNPNYRAEEPEETEEDFMDRNMGPYRPF